MRPGHHARAPPNYRTVMRRRWREWDVSLRGRVERFLQDSAGFVSCCFGLRRWTAPKRRREGRCARRLVTWTGSPHLKRHYEDSRLFRLNERMSRLSGGAGLDTTIPHTRRTCQQRFTVSSTKGQKQAKLQRPPRLFTQQWGQQRQRNRPEPCCLVDLLNAQPSWPKRRRDGPSQGP